MSIEIGESLNYFINRPYAVDNLARLRYGSDWQKSLEPCQPIQDQSLCIGMLGNGTLQLRRLLIADYDRTPIKVTKLATGEVVELRYPGKSTFVLLEPNMCDKMFILNRTKHLFNRESNRSDHVHVISVARLLENDWVPFYAPIQLNGLFDHVRLVFGRTLREGVEPTVGDAEKLRSQFELVVGLHG